MNIFILYIYIYLVYTDSLLGVLTPLRGVLTLCILGSVCKKVSLSIPDEGYHSVSVCLRF